MSDQRVPMRLEGEQGLRACAGLEIGVSPWRVVTQDEVNAFAGLTGDDQWIHVDVHRARQSPFGGTIVHGFFLLSLGPVLAAEVYEVTGFGHGLNYGLERVRFPATMPVGGPLRLRVSLAELADVPGGLRASFLWQFEHEQQAKPVCVASKLTQYMHRVQ